MTTKALLPSSFGAQEWREIDDVYHQLLYWYYDRENLQKARPIARRLERLLSEVNSQTILGESAWALVLECKGDLPGAIRVLDRAVDACRKWTIPAWFPPAASSLGYAYVLSGRFADGVPLLREAIDQAAAMRIAYDEAPTLAWLSEALLLDGRPDEAVSLAQRELNRSRHCGHRGHEAYGLRALAEVAAQFDPHDVETARDSYHQALTLATELGMRPLVAHCHRGLGGLYQRAGKNEQARAHLTSAAAIYREADMRWWLEKIEGSS